MVARSSHPPRADAAGSRASVVVDPRRSSPLLVADRENGARVRHSSTVVASTVPQPLVNIHARPQPVVFLQCTGKKRRQVREPNDPIHEVWFRPPRY